VRKEDVSAKRNTHKIRLDFETPFTNFFHSKKEKKCGEDLPDDK